MDLHLNPLPDPSGKGKDFGFSLNLLNGRFFARINRYETKQVNSRNGQSATLTGKSAGTRSSGRNARGRCASAASAASASVTYPENAFWPASHTGSGLDGGDSPSNCRAPAFEERSAACAARRGECLL